MIRGQIINSAVAVTPSDTVDLVGGNTFGLYVGATGDVKAVLPDGVAVTFVDLAAGVVHPLCVKRVFATGTAATSIVACY